MSSSYYNLKVESESENFVTMALHIDEKELAKSISNIASIMFEVNPQLFNALSDDIIYNQGKVILKEVIEETYEVNSVGVKTLRPYKSLDSIILSFSFGNDNRVKDIQRYDFGEQRLYDVDISKIEDRSYLKILSSKEITIEDIKEAQRVSFVREATLVPNIKTLFISDYTPVKNNAISVDYEIELFVDTKHENYVKKAANSLQKAILFISNHVTFIKNAQFYNYQENRFHDSFVKDFFNKLQIEVNPAKFSLTVNDMAILSRTRFGSLIKDYITAKELLGEEYSKDDIVKSMYFTLLPVPITTPELMENILIELTALHSRLMEKYRISEMNFSVSDVRISNIVNDKKSTTFRTNETYRLRVNNELSYNIITNSKVDDLMIFNQSGLLKRSTNESQRTVTPAAFSPHMTPIGINYQKSTVDLSLGLSAINPTTMKQIRLIKTVKAQESKFNNKYKSSFPTTRAGTVSQNSFNLSIGKCVKSNLESTREGEDTDFMETKEYLPDDSYFIGDVLPFIEKIDKEQINREEARNFKILSDALPKKFLDHPEQVTTLKDINQTAPFSKAFKASKNQRSSKPIPSQISSLAGSGGIKIKDGLDPLKNSESSAVLKETQQNVHTLSVFQGFLKNEQDKYIMSTPIYKILNTADLSSDMPKLIKIEKWSDPSIGLYEEQYSTPVRANMTLVLPSSNTLVVEPVRPSVPALSFGLVDPGYNIPSVLLSLEMQFSPYSTSNVIVQDPNKGGILEILKNFVQPISPPTTTTPGGRQPGAAPSSYSSPRGGGTSGY